jgi:hypothetical protein
LKHAGGSVLIPNVTQIDRASGSETSGIDPKGSPKLPHAEFFIELNSKGLDRPEKLAVERRKCARDLAVERESFDRLIKRFLARAGTQRSAGESAIACSTWASHVRACFSNWARTNRPIAANPGAFPRRPTRCARLAPTKPF